MAKQYFALISVTPSIAEPRKVSQWSIAHALGLSQAAVSHALNGKRENCNPKTYARIWSHALAVGYQGKGLERAAVPHTEMRHVGILHGDGLSGARPSTFLSSLQWGLENHLSTHGIAALPLGSTDAFRKIIFSKLVRGAAPKPGLVILGQVSATFLQQLKTQTHRIVTVGISFPELAPAILNDDSQAAELLVPHLRNRGHTGFAWFSGNENEHSPSAQSVAVSEAIIKAGALLQAGYTLSSAKPGRAAGRDCASVFLRRAASDAGPVPTAIICSDALVARGAIDEFGRAGISVPGNLSVAAMDITHGREDEAPEITAAASSPEKMGLAAAELVTDYPAASSGRFRRVVLPATFVVGATTGPVSTSKRKPFASRHLFLPLESEHSSYESQRLTA